MPFDHIMGVGRTPQINSDVIVNPFSFVKEDIAQYSNSSKTQTGTYTTLTYTGSSLQDITNPDISGTDATPLTITLNKAAGDLGKLEHIFDLNKIFYLRRIAFYMQSSAVPIGSFVYMRVYVSTDGINYSLIASKASSASSDIYDGEVYYQKARFIKLSFENIANVSGSGNHTLLIRFLRIAPDDLQY